MGDAKSMSPPDHILDPDGEILLVVEAHSSSINEKESGPEDTEGRAFPKQIHMGLKLQVFAMLTEKCEAQSLQGDSSVFEVKNEPPICFQVSSRHLTLASPIFKDMIGSCSPQNQQLQPGNLERVPLRGDDPKALLILLCLVHCRFKEIPRKVTLKMLTKIALIVDKYELLGVTELVADQWISGIKHTVPAILNENLLSWLFIAVTFDKKDIFETVTRVATFQSKGLLEAQSVPIPGQILARIEAYRQTALREIFVYLEKVLLHLLSKEERLNHEDCDRLALGSLLRGLKKLNLYDLPQFPFEDLCVADTFESLKGLSIPQACRKYPQEQRNKGSRHSYIHDYHGQSSQCEAVDNPLEDEITRLESQLEENSKKLAEEYCS